MLACREVTVSFGETIAVDRATLEVNIGRVGGLIGPSGCGKSTLLRVIAGLQRPDHGSITWNGADITAAPPHARPFGLMFQDYALFPHLDVAANVAFALRFSDTSRAEANRRVGELLDLVGLPGYESRTIDGLSGGEQQRVALARTLAPSPDVLMLDEPLGALDRSLRDDLVPEMRRIFSALGTTALYVTHDHDEAFAVADGVFVMRDGAIVGHGSPAQLWERPPDLETARFLGYGPVVAATVSNGRLDVGFAVAPWSGPAGSYSAAMRPGAVVIDPDGAIDAVVADATYTKDGYELRLEIGETTVAVRCPDRLPAGTRVRAAVDPDHIALYPAQPSTSSDV